ncbi:unnamed protein product [Phaedon cochleariae]|uniref:Uncharacterized protein n=1 Tax=Phaedon cochleariae TaxID=80249 RepID=A0A9P0DPP9_PHACE|nr:unnamed protein product [Phaedon cochleariae]
MRTRDQVPVHVSEVFSPKNVNVCIPQVDSVPEELFRRYTDTDSRPQTPAPTLASGTTRASDARRCFTPDPFPSNEIREKTQLILDLRRSHSQENLSCQESILFDPPIIRIQQVSTRPPSLEESKVEKSKISKPFSNKESNSSKRPESVKKVENVDQTGKNLEEDKNNTDEEEDTEFIKRRGKRRRKKGSDASKGPTTYQASLDPETQVGTIGPESRNPSARHSMTPEHFSGVENACEEMKKKGVPARMSSASDVQSYLDADILKLLRRELNERVVDSELDYKRRKALEEALRTLVKGRPVCDELLKLQKELRIPPVNANLWISLPRTFTRSSAIFQLPMDSRTLSTLTPIEYLRDNVQITSARKLLYNCIFDQWKMEMEDDVDYERQILGKELQSCLNLVMGKLLTCEQYEYFKKIVNVQDTEILHFKECCGIFALCERLLAPQFCPQLPDRKSDPCHEIENADFAMLQRKLDGRQISENLKEILLLIKSL